MELNFSLKSRSLALLLRSLSGSMTCLRWNNSSRDCYFVNIVLIKSLIKTLFLSRFFMSNYLFNICWACANILLLLRVSSVRHIFLHGKMSKSIFLITIRKVIFTVLLPIKVSTRSSTCWCSRWSCWDFTLLNCCFILSTFLLSDLVLPPIRIPLFCWWYWSSGLIPPSILLGV